MRFLVTGITASLLLLLTISAVSADKGMVGPALPHEPGQKAIIAWDGENEVLILSTDVYASENSWALEILPLPSVPTVTRGDRELFYKVNLLIGDHISSVSSQAEIKRTGVNLAMFFTMLLAALCASIIAMFRMKVSPKLICLLWIIGLAILLPICLVMEMGRPGGGVAGVEIIFHENIGARDITAVKSDNAQGLIGWAEDFLENRGIVYDLSLTEMENMCTAYIESGMNYFVFDLVDLKQEWMSIDPIVYEFKSDFLYYPLKISSLASGTTKITLVTITSGAVEQQHIENAGLSVESWGGGPLEFELRKDELEQIAPEVAEMFNGSARLTTLVYDGPLANLSGDLKAEVTEVPKGVEVDPYTAFWIMIACLWVFIVVITYRLLPHPPEGCSASRTKAIHLLRLSVFRYQ